MHIFGGRQRRRLAFEEQDVYEDNVRGEPNLRKGQTAQALCRWACSHEGLDVHTQTEIEEFGKGEKSQETRAWL